MVDIKIVDILKEMKEEETDKIGTENTNTTYTHGDRTNDPIIKPPYKVTC